MERDAEMITGCAMLFVFWDDGFMLAIIIPKLKAECQVSHIPYNAELRTNESQ